MEIKGKESKENLLKTAVFLAVLTIGYNVIEGIASVYFGLDDETLALFGFGLDSFVEVISGIGILHMVLRIQQKGDDQRDNFEKKALRVTGTSFYLLTIGLLFFGITNLFTGAQPENTFWGIVVAGLSIFVMWWLINEKVKIGSALDSAAIISDANCTKTCMQLSIILLISSVSYKIFEVGSIDAIGSLFIAGISFNEGREAFQKAKNAGIPVYAIDREINATGIASAQLVSNNYQGAVLGGEEFIKAMGEGGEFIELIGKETDTNAGIRSKGYNDAIADYPDMVKVAAQSANWSQSEAFEVMEKLIQAHPNVKGVIAGNDTMALGASAALKAAGMNNVIVAGFDGSREVMDAIVAGDINHTVLQPIANFSEMAVRMAHEEVTTGSAPSTEKQSIDCLLVNKGNVGKCGVFRCNF